MVGWGGAGGVWGGVRWGGVWWGGRGVGWGEVGWGEVGREGGGVGSYTRGVLRSLCRYILCCNMATCWKAAGP